MHEGAFPRSCGVRISPTPIASKNSLPSWTLGFSRFVLGALSMGL
jgi:hypothetical protein